MKQLIVLFSLGWASMVWAQDDNLVSGDDAGPVTPEQAEHFDIMQLPKGASVVLPHPASTIVPLNIKVQVSATDRKQILKITAINQGGSTKPVKLAIFDLYQSRVKYLDVRPGSFVIYAFKNLNSLQLVPQNSKDPALKQTRLLLESNRPLGVSY
ncbi:MAG: hypothetical protein M3Q07_14475 [Pseudobdellovibrionaceae bacterium]|nr:hypothetical protein [Pseudobdellovibrionaceae bacterium]